MGALAGSGKTGRHRASRLEADDVPDDHDDASDVGSTPTGSTNFVQGRQSVAVSPGYVWATVPFPRKWGEEGTLERLSLDDPLNSGAYRAPKSSAFGNEV